MPLLFLDTLKEISGYSDVRSIRKWVQGMHLTLVRVGKNYATDKIALEAALAKQQRITRRQITYRPIHQTEKSFLADLELLLSENSELS